MAGSKNSDAAAARTAERNVEYRRLLPEVVAILDDYAKLKIGAAGADEKIVEMLSRKGFARIAQIPPMQVGFHKKESR